MSATKTAVALVVEPAKKAGDLPYWAASWRVEGRPVKRRLGSAWLVPVGSADAKPNARAYGVRGDWVQRRGRVPEGVLDEAAARSLADAIPARFAGQLEEAAEARRREAMTFRALARE